MFAICCFDGMVYCIYEASHRESRMNVPSRTRGYLSNAVRNLIGSLWIELLFESDHLA